MGDDLVDTSEMIEDQADFDAAENHGQTLGSLGLDDLAQVDGSSGQDRSKEEQQSRQSLILGGGGDVSGDCQMRKKGIDVDIRQAGGHFEGKVLEELTDPRNVGGTGPGTVMPGPKSLVDRDKNFFQLGGPPRLLGTRRMGRGG